MNDPSMATDFLVVLIFLLAAIGFVVFNLIAPKLFRPINPNSEKLTGYECGERPVGSPWIRFNLRYYIIALLFIIFDVEVVFVVPWAVVYRDLLANPNVGLLAFFEMFVFLLILGVGLAYCWAKGYLEWVLRSVKRETSSDS